MGRSRAASKAPIHVLLAGINFLGSVLGITGIKYLVSVLAHPYLLGHI